MNIVLIVLDSLRQDHVGAYGNDWIITPNLDRLAGESVLFTHCYPESLPTLPVRRALHTGKRTFPFRKHRDYKGDFRGAPGWGPIPEEQHTVAETLSEMGYHTALITDTYHYFKPSKNFHRGFQEWIWIRGQERDSYRTGPPIENEQLAVHLPSTLGDDPRVVSYLRHYLRNNSRRATEEDYHAARVFAEAARWVWDNQCAEKFFLVVDSFDPHEPWDPPTYYRQLYDSDDGVVDVIHSLYGPWKGVLTPREVRRVQANYAGEVTMVDRWLGHFVETLRYTGRLDKTIIAVISDHGHNLGVHPGDQGLISKQGYPMTRAVADLVMMIRHPDGIGAGTVWSGLCYNHDLAATLLTMIGVAPKGELDGNNVWTMAISGKAGRDYVCIGWGPLITVISDCWWYNADIWGQAPRLYNVKEDPALQHNVAEEHLEICERLRLLAVEDAGGKISEEFANYSDRPGCTPILV
jgi:arylsulfatase A-like enzyme